MLKTYTYDQKLQNWNANRVGNFGNLNTITYINMQ